jgi:hypothetical protein
LSEIRVNTVSDAAGTGPATLTGQAANKAWAVLINGTSTLAIGDSLNVSSVTDAGAGLYWVNWSNSFNTTSYATTAGTVGQNYSYAFGTGYYNRTVGTIYTMWMHHSGSVFDLTEASVMSTGVLA